MAVTCCVLRSPFIPSRNSRRGTNDAIRTTQYGVSHGSRRTSPRSGVHHHNAGAGGELGRKYSLFPLTFGLACCAIEQIASGVSRFDISRFGSEVFRPSPRQADLLIVSGRVSHKMAPVVKRLYDQMLEPKWVIAMGICASAGGPFNNYAILQGVDKIIPVDVYVPGCPPRPEALLYALTLLQKKVQGEKFRDRAYSRKQVDK